MELVTGENDSGRRLDRILRKALKGHPLSLIHRLLRQGKVRVNGKAAGPGARVSSGAVIAIDLNEPEPQGKAAGQARCPKPERSPPAQLDIIWQGKGLLVLNKPAGLAVHGPESLDIMVQAYLADRLPPSLSFKAGPLHRLDKPSSGIIVFSSSLEGARYFSSLMRARQIKKYYLALVEGRIETGAVWEDDLFRDKTARKTFVFDAKVSPAPGRQESAEKKKRALTTVELLETNGAYSLVKAEIGTGRTHQIRAQAAARGHPLAGDLKYGGHPLQGQGRPGGFFLHAWKLVLGEETFTAPLPGCLPVTPAI